MKEVILVEDLSFNYPGGVEALKNINFSVYKGESIGIIGPNGAGKSTLLLCLNGILKGRGRIVVNGLELNDKNIFSIRKDIGFVFQDPDDQLFMPTVYEDVSFGLAQMGLPEGEIERRVKIALSTVGMSGFENRLAHHLSFGEKKKITLAGVLAMEPNILLLDEPTSNLDPRGRHNLIGLLKTIESTKIVATHDLGLVLDLCNRVFIIDRGKIVLQGPVVEILSDANVLMEHGLEQPVGLLSISR